MFTKYSVSSFIAFFDEFTAGTPRFHICFVNTTPRKSAYVKISCFSIYKQS